MNQPQHTKTKKAAEMSTLFTKKGNATPAISLDKTTPINTNNEQSSNAKTNMTENLSSALTADQNPIVESDLPTASKAVERVEGHIQAAASIAIPNAAVGSALGDILRQIAASENVQKPAKISMVPVNMKLPSETIDKLKQIVGIEQYRRSNNFSQQNYLESRMVALIDLEYAALPKI